jgi:hypothetical protein
MLSFPIAIPAADRVNAPEKMRLGELLIALLLLPGLLLHGSTESEKAYVAHGHRLTFPAAIVT